MPFPTSIESANLSGTARRAVPSLDQQRGGEARLLPAHKLIAQMRAWGATCPAYREALRDGAEEIAWVSRLPSCAGRDDHQPPSGLKYGARQIITTLLLWAELYPEYARSLRACAEEVTEITRRQRPVEDKQRARAIVLEALSAGYQTSPQIVEQTGLSARRVQRALLRLVQLGLAEVCGCGARSAADGNRTRLYALSHTPPERKNASH